MFCRNNEKSLENKNICWTMKRARTINLISFNFIHSTYNSHFRIHCLQFSIMIWLIFLFILFSHNLTLVIVIIMGHPEDVFYLLHHFFPFRCDLTSRLSGESSFLLISMSNRQANFPKLAQRNCYWTGWIDKFHLNLPQCNCKSHTISH